MYTDCAQGDVLAVLDQMGDTLQLLEVSSEDGSLAAVEGGLLHTPHQPSFVTFLADV